MKNFEFIWAREHAGLTQSQTADLIGVHRGTIARWELGTVKVPNRRWHAFLKLVGVAASQLPKPREYDAEGYLVGFDRSLFDIRNPAHNAKYFIKEEDDCDLYDDSAAGDDQEDALISLEGDEYPFRARERHRIMFSRFSHGTAAERKRDLAAEMARYDEETAQLVGPLDLV